MPERTKTIAEDYDQCEICGDEIQPGEEVTLIGDMTICSEHDGEK